MLELQKAVNADWAPLTWRAYRDLNGKQKAYMIDPHSDGLTLAQHTIDQDGTVHPSVLCTLCGFHDNIKLLGWEKCT